MRKILYAIAFFVASYAIKAQVKTPQSSPKTTVNQVVGLTDVTIEYSRPSAKGRTIFGDLVPFGKLWRTGANANSTVSFSEEVSIDGKTLAKGKYALFTIPKADNWEFIFYKTTDNWGTPEEFKESDVALRANAKPVFLERKVESLTMGIASITNDSAELEISWEKTSVALKFEVPTQKAAMASITKTLAGPAASDYYNAAQYFYQANIEMAKALEYVSKAVGLVKTGEDVPFWHLRLKSLIQAKLGDKKGAIETAKLSLAGAQKAKNDDYVKMNNDSIKEWSK
jgi:hypothetical protein